MRRPILMIALLLLLANAGSLYWFTQHPAATIGTTEAPASTPKGIARLKLISEVSPDQLIAATTALDTPPKTEPVVVAAKPSEPPTAIEPAVPPPPIRVPVIPTKKPYCFVTPPFNANAGDDAVLRILAHIPDVEVNSDTRKQAFKSTTYWVRIRGFRPLKEAVALVNELREKGIKDVATTPMKGSNTVVSLGLYRLKESATDRVSEITGMGYETEIIELKKTHLGLRYRINILATSEAEARGYLREYRNAFPKHPPQLQDCP